MMNISTSECSSGCESGWTTYLDHQHSDYSIDPYYNSNNNSKHFVCAEKGGVNSNDQDQHHQEDEDLSMVSDASSGPPLHFREYENCSVDNTKKKKKNKKSNAKREQNLCLDDTASSSVFHFSQDNVPPSEDVPGFSKVFSDAHFEDESITKKHFGFFKSSTKGKSGSLLGRKKQ